MFFYSLLVLFFLTKMRFEIPECLRCCFCIPLRHGILVFGYLNLLFTLFVISVEAWLDFGYPITFDTMAMYRGVGMYSQMWVTFILYLLEVIFNLVLIVGAHTKRVVLMRAYYYYGIMTTVAVFFTFIVIRYENGHRDWYFESFEVCFAFSAFLIEIYLLFLIRSELQKVRYQDGQFRYVNHMAEVVVDQPLPSGNGRNPL